MVSSTILRPLEHPRARRDQPDRRFPAHASEAKPRLVVPQPAGLPTHPTLRRLQRAKAVLATPTAVAQGQKRGPFWVSDVWRLAAPRIGNCKIRTPACCLSGCAEAEPGRNIRRARGRGVQGPLAALRSWKRRHNSKRRLTVWRCCWTTLLVK